MLLLTWSLHVQVEFDDSEIDAYKFAIEVLRESEEAECQKCSTIMARPMITQCGHFFCTDCVEQFLASDQPICTVCEAVIGAQTIMDGSIAMRKQKPSTKVVFCIH